MMIGSDKMTEKKRLFVGRKTVEDRFTLILDYDDEIGVKENRSGDVLVLKHRDLNSEQFVAQLVVFLNDQNQAIVDLYDSSKYWSEKATERIKELEEENEQLKQFPVKLDNRIQKLQEDLQKLTEMDKIDLNPQAVEDVATVIGISLNALLEFKKEMMND